MYSPVSVFPGTSADGNNYWVDPVFTPPPPPEPEPEPDDPPTADSQTVSVNEDGSVSITLAGSDDVTAANALTYTIETLPLLGILKHNGVAVAAGQTFVGSPTGLTYEPGAEQEGAAADSFNFSVTDGAGHVSDQATVSIDIVKAVADGSVVLGTGGILRVGGTAGTDVISISRTSTGKFRVMYGLTVVSDTIPVASVSEIRVWGRGGNDGIALVNVSTPAMLSGGAGTDVIAGGDGRDLILGGLGDDALTGMSGDDVIVGGDGKDALLGLAGHDVLIAGGLGMPVSLGHLRALGAEWAATRSVTADEAEQAEEVLTDDDVDVLVGGAGSDWFIVSLRDFVLDFTRLGTSRDVITYV
jgi:Ca2+-binding RTX toxin-like protein